MSTNPIVVKFDASLDEKTSGAAFEIRCRDLEHAKEVVNWLRSKVVGFAYAHAEIVPDPVKINI